MQMMGHAYCWSSLEPKTMILFCWIFELEKKDIPSKLSILLLIFSFYIIWYTIYICSAMCLTLSCVFNLNCFCILKLLIWKKYNSIYNKIYLYKCIHFENNLLNKKKWNTLFNILFWIVVIRSHNDTMIIWKLNGICFYTCPKAWHP